jgi:hypothetical protein
VEQWTFGLEYQLPANTVVSATYIGNHGVKLAIPGIDRNQLAPQYLSLGSALLTQVNNPFYGYIQTGSLAGRTISEGQLLRPFPQFTNFTASNVDGGMSTYNAFTIGARRRFAEGLQFLVNYTGSKFLTNTEGLSGFSNGQSIQNYYNLSLEKSLAGEDIPRSFVASFVYELPIGTGKKLRPRNRIINGIVGGWQLAGIYSLKSGFPLGVRNATNNDFTMSGTQRPNIVGNPNQVTRTLNEWFNINAFAQPAAFTFGNAPRLLPNTRADGTNDLDAILSKYWQLWSEEARLQLRFELYNTLNHPMFYAPNTTFGNPAFGTVTGALPPRDVQLGMKLTW